MPSKKKLNIPDFLGLNYFLFNKDGQILEWKGLANWFEEDSSTNRLKEGIDEKLVPLISLYPNELISFKLVIENRDFLIKVGPTDDGNYLLHSIEIPALGNSRNRGKEFELQSLSGLNHIYVVRLDLNGYYTYANKAFCDRFGYTPESIKGVEFKSTIHPDDIHKCEEIVAQLLSNPNWSVSNKIRKPDKDGKYLDTEWEYQARFDADGTLLEIQAIGRDLSNFEETISKLKSSNEQYERSIEGGDLVIWDWILEIGKIRLNKKWWDILQTNQKEESISMSAWEKWIHPEDVHQVKVALLELTQQEATKIDLDFRILTYFEQIKHLHISGKIMEMTEHGKVRRISGIIQDISEKKEKENLIRMIEERNHAIISNFSDGVVIQDMNGAIISCNKSAEQILGLSFEQMLGRKSIDPRWRSIHEDGSDFPGAEHPAMVTIQTGKPQKNVTMGVHKPDGSLSWINISSQFLFKGTNREPYGVFAIFHDITEKKQYEDEIKKNRALLDETSRMAHVGGWEYYLETNNFVWSDEVYRIHGLEPGTPLRSEDTINFYSEESQPIIQHAFQQLLEEGIPFDKKLVLNLSSGKQVDVHVIGKPWYESGKMRKIFGSIQDISIQKKQETDLLDERNRLQNILEATDAGTYEWNPITNEVWVNSRWTTMLGYSPGEVQISNFDDIKPFYHPEDYPIIFEKAKDHIDGKTDMYSVEVRMLSKSGKSVWVYERGKTIKRNSKGAPLLIAGTHIEITKNKSLEEEIILLSLVAENLSNLVILTQLNGLVLWANSAFTDLCGLPLAILKGHHLREFFPNNPASENPAEIRNILESGNSYQRNWIILDSEGNEREILFEIKMIFNKEGKPLAVLSNGKLI